MEYIHKSSIGYHGNLTSQNTLIDGHWVLKLTKFGLNTLKEKEEVRPSNSLGVGFYFLSTLAAISSFVNMKLNFKY